MDLPFTRSARSTVGLEWELALVDADSAELRQVAPAVLDAVRPPGAESHPHVHPELLLNTIEVVSGVGRTVAQAGADLDRTVAELRAVTEPLRVELMCAGTHPFARPFYQRVTDKARYAELINRTQWWGRQMVIYGVHVHVGVEDRAKVLPIVEALLTVLPHLQALSASSPYWEGTDTGYASNRTLLFQQLPTAGLPVDVHTWTDLEGYVAGMLKTGVIDAFDELRWDVRPSPRFGTIELRAFDGVSNLSELLSLAALAHCLVEHFSTLLDDGERLPAMPRWFVEENKWRSARYGLDAIVILDADGEEALVTEDLARWLDRLAPTARRLGCAEELAGVADIVAHGASYQRQRTVSDAHHGDLGYVVGHLVAEMRAGRPLAP